MTPLRQLNVRRGAAPPARVSVCAFMASGKWLESLSHGRERVFCYFLMPVNLRIVLFASVWCCFECFVMVWNAINASENRIINALEKLRHFIHGILFKG